MEYEKLRADLLARWDRNAVRNMMKANKLFDRLWEDLHEDKALEKLPLPWPEFNKIASRRFRRAKKVKFITKPELT